MKIKYIRYAVMFTVAILMMPSCIDLEELNEDPNNATTTQPALLLTNIEYSSFAKSSTGAAYAIKQIVKTDGESQEQVYKWSRGNFDYYSSLRDVTKMQEVAEEGSAYKALAAFFRANYFFQTTMDFGDIPYSDALKGESQSIYTPKYDTQEQVFEGILKELADADALLKDSKEIIDGDIIYDGDLLKWRKLINAYRLRILITLSGKHNVGSINIVDEFKKAAAGPLMENIEDNGQIVYLDQEGNRYPNFNSSGFGSGMYMDQTYIDLMKSLKDPRLFAIATQTPNAEKAGKSVDDFSSYDGGDPSLPYAEVNEKAKEGNCSKPAERYYQNPVNEPSIIMGYTEQQLILAEAVARGWITGDDKAYYDSAVKASFQFYHDNVADVAEYLDENAANTYLAGQDVQYEQSYTFDQKLKLIAIQKYLPTFLQGNLWLPYYEQLRTGYPEFKRAAGVDLPYRWMYPQDEYNSNAANVQAALDRQFGGSDKTSDMPWWIK